MNKNKKNRGELSDDAKVIILEKVLNKAKENYRNATKKKDEERAQDVLLEIENL